jgi:hypothetical protein
MSNQCNFRFGKNGPLCQLSKGHGESHRYSTDQAIKEFGLENASANVKLDQGSDGTCRVYEQAEVDALIAAAEQCAYDEAWMDRAELEAGNRTTGRMPTGALARHDAEVRERALDFVMQRGEVRYSRDQGEPDPSPAFPTHVEISMEDWEHIRALKESHAAAAKKD